MSKARATKRIENEIKKFNDGAQSDGLQITVRLCIYVFFDTIKSIVIKIKLKCVYK